MVCGFEADLLMAVLVRSVAGENGGDVEDDAGFLVGEGVLRGGLMCEGVEPGAVSLCPPSIYACPAYHVKLILMWFSSTGKRRSSSSSCP